MAQLRNVVTGPIRVTRDFLEATEESQQAGVEALIAIAAAPAVTQRRRSAANPLRVTRQSPAVADEPTRESQMAGIAALIAIAMAPSAVSHYGLPAAQTGTNLRFPDGISYPKSVRQPTLVDVPQGQKPQEKQAKPDRLVRNSLYLVLSSGLQAAFGFGFWVITARLFSTTDLGISSSLISAATVISFISILGLNSTFVRYLPTASDSNALITIGLILVAVCGAVVSII